MPRSRENSPRFFSRLESSLEANASQLCFFLSRAKPRIPVARELRPPIYPSLHNPPPTLRHDHIGLRSLMAIRLEAQKQSLQTAPCITQTTGPPREPGNKGKGHGQEDEKEEVGRSLLPQR